MIRCPGCGQMNAFSCEKCPCGVALPLAFRERVGVPSARSEGEYDQARYAALPAWEQRSQTMDALAERIADANDQRARARWNEFWAPPTGERKKRIDRRANLVIFVGLPLVGLAYAIFFKMLGIW